MGQLSHLDLGGSWKLKPKDVCLVQRIYQTKFQKSLLWHNVQQQRDNYVVQVDGNKAV